MQSRGQRESERGLNSSPLRKLNIHQGLARKTLADLRRSKACSQKWLLKETLTTLAESQLGKITSVFQIALFN